MSFTIDQAFIDQFADMFHVVAQQKRSRLEPYVNNRGSVQGRAFTIDVLGTTTYNEVIQRHGDTPLNPGNETRRFADMRDGEAPADLIDRLDQLKLLIQPQSEYVRNQIAALNRFKDVVISNALLGSVRTTSGTSALPGAQQIANGGTALTLTKLRQARERLDDAEQDSTEFFQQMGVREASTFAPGGFGQGMPSYVLVVTPKQISDLLADTTATSADYNSIKALVDGSINTFMGFRFVSVSTTSGVLPKASTIRSCIAYAPHAVHFGKGKDASAIINQRPDKRNAWQVYSDISVGAGRAEDAGVVQIDVVES